MMQQKLKKLLKNWSDSNPRPTLTKGSLGGFFRRTSSCAPIPFLSYATLSKGLNELQSTIIHRTKNTIVR